MSTKNNMQTICDFLSKKKIKIKFEIEIQPTKKSVKVCKSTELSKH